MIVGLNHFTVVASDPPRTLAFYAALGLREGYRPELGFAGAWLYADDRPEQALLHMYFDRPPPSPPAGVIDHMAFSARDLRGVTARLDAAGTRYELRRQKGAGTWQLFCHDPDGAKVELDFDPSEER